MTILEVKKGLIDKMKTVFTEDKYEYYGFDVKEGYKRPCFFTQIKPVDISPLNYNSKKIQATFYIDYLQKSINEVDALSVTQKLQDLFELYVKIGDRAVYVNGFDWDYVGTNKNIIEISIDLEWYVRISHNEEFPIMETANLKTEMEE